MVEVSTRVQKAAENAENLKNFDDVMVSFLGFSSTCCKSGKHSDLLRKPTILTLVLVPVLALDWMAMGEELT